MTSEATHSRAGDRRRSGLRRPSIRQARALAAAREHVRTGSVAHWALRLSPDLAALEVGAALEALAEVAGETTPEDVLERIFSNFCIGK